MIHIEEAELEHIIKEAIKASWVIEKTAWEATEEAMKQIKERSK